MCEIDHGKTFSWNLPDKVCLQHITRERCVLGPDEAVIRGLPSEALRVSGCFHMFRGSLDPHGNALYLHVFLKKSIDELRRITFFDTGDKFLNSVFSQQTPLLRSLFVRSIIRT